MRDLVPELSQQFGDFLDLPYTFYGHSLGALVAFEVARALRRRGEPEPRHLVVGAARAPHVPNPYPPIHRLEERQFLEEIQKRYGGIPSEVMDDAEMRALLTPVLRADVGIIETYQYVQDEPLGCDVVAFGGLRDPMVTRSSLEAWREQTTGDFQLTMIDGDHFFGQSRRLELLGQISNIIRKQGHAAMAARNGMGGVL
jgi:surfactin synthase thioesterase subunit